MATLAAQPPAVRFRAPWLINPRADLIFIIGSAAAGYFFLGLHVLLQIPVSFIWWFWSVGFDGTHIFATASRTFFDSEARRTRRLLLFGSLLFFFSLGPLLILAGWKPLLVSIVAVWAYYHVIRQHYGFLVLYKVKQRDFGRLDQALDRLFLGVMMVAPPFHRFFVHSPRDLGMPARWALDQRAPAVEPVLWVMVAAAAGIWLFRQTQRWFSGEAANVPKLLLLAGIVPLHWITFAFTGWQAAVPIVTIGHNLQYHALVWFHNRNRYSSDENASWIPRLSARSLAGYASVALLFSAAYRIPGFHLGRASDLAFGLFCGFGLTHYYLDSRIWRVKSDPSLRGVLQLNR